MDIRFDTAKGILSVGDTSNVSQPASTPTQDTPDLMPGVNQLMCSGDPGAIMAALTMQTAHDQEQVSRTQRDQAERAQEGAERAEIADLHAKADLMRAQGIADGVCEIAQAGMDFASGVKGLDATSDKLKADNMDKDLHPKGTNESNELRDAGNHAECAANGWKSGGEAMGGVKSIVHGFFDAEITNKDADSKEHDMQAQAFKQMADDAHDAENDAKSLLDKALDFYKEYVDTKNQTTMAAIHRA